MKEQLGDTPESQVRKTANGNEDDNNIGGGSMSSLSTASTGLSQKAQVGESSLNPYSGSLKCRMDHTISHLPTKCKNVKDYCQLHYWCTGKRCTSNTAFCFNCNVVL